KFRATQAREPEAHYEHKEIGYNYRMSNVVAGIGRGQLKVLEDRVQQKRHIFHSYQEGLADIEEISFIDEMEDERANFWLSTLLIDLDKVTPKMIMDALAESNIESRPIWKPMHIQPIFEKYDHIGGKVSEEYFEKGLCLPSDTKMTDKQIELVI